MNDRPPILIGRTGMILAGLMLLAAGGGATVARRASAAEQRAGAAAAAAERELVARNEEIAVYEGALRLDTASAAFRARLAALYLQRSRETGDHADLVRAEGAARAALARRTHHNGAAFVTLVNSLLAQHQFEAAFAVARQLVAGQPEVPAYRALLGEAALELGEYDVARAAFDSLGGAWRELSIAPRLARWRELTGDVATARSLLERARRDAAARADLPREQRAWFHLRLADFEIRAGRLHRAEALLRAGLAIAPADARLLGASARLAAVRGRWKDAIRDGEKSLTTAIDPATLGVISDAYAALADSAKAAEYSLAMEVAASTQPGAQHRSWALFLLDHNRRVPEILANARRDLVTRRDIYGYDLLAWALYKSGQYEEAQRAMQHALRLGTRDPMLSYHASLIARAAGRPSAALSYASTVKPPAREAETR